MMMNEDKAKEKVPFQKSNKQFKGSYGKKLTLSCEIQRITHVALNYYVY